MLKCYSPRQGPTGLAGNSEVFPWIGAPELLHQGSGGQPEGLDQTTVRGSHTEDAQGRHHCRKDAGQQGGAR